LITFDAASVHLLGEAYRTTSAAVVAAAAAAAAADFSFLETALLGNALCGCLLLLLLLLLLLPAAPRLI